MFGFFLILDFWSFELLWQIKVLNGFLTLCKSEFGNAFGNNAKVESKILRHLKKYLKLK